MKLQEARIEVKKIVKSEPGTRNAGAYDRMPGMMKGAGAVWGIFKDGKLFAQIKQSAGSGLKFWQIYNFNTRRLIGPMFDTRKQAAAWALKNKKWDVK